MQVKDKTLLVTGGTGSFGRAVLDKFVDSDDFSEIRIFSRDEEKQDSFRNKFKNEKLKFYIGDVRDINSIHKAMRNVDYVFHAAALKQVPSCEFFPVEAVKTNILGAQNVIESADKHGVEKVVCLSTDKAAYPINAMGMSKALMEKVAISASRAATNTTICLTRYGNVIASRGSVIPLFLSQIRNNEPLTLTDPNMTRFLMSLEDAIDLVLFAFEHGQPGDLFVNKAPAANMENLAQAIKELYGREDIKTKIIGTRHGEKLYETLCTREEMSAAHDMGKFYKIAIDNRDMNYSKYIYKGEKNISSSQDYNSHNALNLNVEQIKALLLSCSLLKKMLA